MKLDEALKISKVERKVDGETGRPQGFASVEYQGSYFVCDDEYQCYVRNKSAKSNERGNFSFTDINHNLAALLTWEVFNASQQ